MKRFIPALCVFALAALLTVPAFAEAPALPDLAPADDAVQPVDCEQLVVDPELAQFGLVPEPTLMAPLCGPCSMGECRGKALNSGCALHAEEPVPGTCKLASSNQCFDGTAICSCVPN
jgi:hypothetical protein